MEAQGNLLGSILPLIVLVGIFYFLIIRPQQKQAKEHSSMIEELKKGDKIVSSGGIIVEIVKVEDEFFTVKNPDNSTMKLSKDYVSKKLD
jgi:preprotein translocase subunit YajC